MSRGKYRTRAEAANARDSAERQAETLAEKCRRLEAELGEERRSHADTSAKLAAALVRVNEGSSEQREVHEAAQEYLWQAFKAQKAGLLKDIRRIIRVEGRLSDTGWELLERKLASTKTTPVDADAYREARANLPSLILQKIENENRLPMSSDGR